MIAVYFVEESRPYNTYCIEINHATKEDLISAIIDKGYPLPSHDVVFIENDKIVNMIIF